MTATNPAILILTDSDTDAEVLRLALCDDYPRTHASTNTAQFESEFEKLQPQVLLFAFRSLETSEMHYVNLHRNSTLTNTLPHISLVLCDKNDARRAYELCRDDVFDDYVLFWPMAHDARRLPMSVHLALRALQGQNAAGSLAQLTAQARRIADLDVQLQCALEAGRDHTAKVQSAVTSARKGIQTTLDRLSNTDIVPRDAQAASFDALRIIRQEAAKLGEATVQPSFKQADQAMQELQRWITTLQAELAGPLAAVRSLRTDSAPMSVRILVVDDDEIMRKLLTRVLAAEHYSVEAVGNAFAALKHIQNERPDLILMDVQMPTINGIQLTRQLKEIENYASIPVVMLTGKGERQVIMESREAGAADFIVKPFEREVLLNKLKKHVAP